MAVNGSAAEILSFFFLPSFFLLLLMKYNVWLLREDGSPSPIGPSGITADGLVNAQQLAAQTLAELQSEGMLTGWTIKTVADAGQ